MFDHVGLNVKDYSASRAFYEQALAPLGWTVAMEFDEHKAVAFGAAGKPELWIVEREPYGTGTHVALPAADNETVDAFHAAALAAGGTDNGPPGLRPYHATYYGAFVLDPDGNNIEAVCHGLGSTN
ncbi:MAG TPA: VOC family protein [Gaiellaceae bacterium]|nr:VOC family protein [Gaiellaceae bacterium]